MISEATRQSRQQSREDSVGEPQQDGSQASPVKLSTGHAISAYRIHPPFIPELGDLVTPLLEQHLDTLGNVSFEKDPLLSGVRERPGSARADAGITGSKSPALATATGVVVVLASHGCT